MGAKVPQNEVQGSENSLDLSFRGANVPGIKWDRKGKFQGNNWPGSKKARKRKGHAAKGPGSYWPIRSRERTGPEVKRLGTVPFNSASTLKSATPTNLAPQVSTINSEIYPCLDAAIVQ